MDPWLLDFAWLIASFIFGIFLGCLTGLIPGFHVNNVALIALSLSPVAVGIGIPLDAVAGIIVACGTVHTFLNYIPSALVGAPDDNMALALLPGHRMLISGQAAQGVAYSARGSQMGMLMSIPLLIVARLLFGDNPGLGLYEASRDQLPWLLLFISVFLILTETTRLPWPEWSQKVTQKLNYPLKKRIEFNIPLGKFSIRRRYDSIDLRLGASSRTAGILVATSYFLLTGFYGWAVFELPARSPVGIPSASLLFPSLAGLFGIANLIDIYVTTSEIPPQENNWEMPPWKPLAVPTFLSAVVSSVMAILPGMTAAQATVVVMSARNLWGKLTDPNYIPADFEHGTQPGFENMPQMMVFEGMEELEAEERQLFQEALAEAGASPDLDLVNNNQQRDLEIIAILSSVNTAVTVMVTRFPIHGRKAAFGCRSSSQYDVPHRHLECCRTSSRFHPIISDYSGRWIIRSTCNDRGWKRYAESARTSSIKDTGSLCVYFYHDSCLHLNRLDWSRYTCDWYNDWFDGSKNWD